MKINLSPFEIAEKIKNKVRAKLNIPKDILIDFALDNLHAVNDLTRSIADLHPHKRSIAVFGAQPPPLSDVARAFAKQGYVVQEIPCDFKLDKDKSKALPMKFLETIKKDTLFVLASDVEPITGVYYPLDLIREELLKKNIFLLRYQSQASLQEGLKIPADPLEAFIADPYFGKVGLSVILKGGKLVGERLLWGEPTLNEEAVLKSCDEILKLKIKADSKSVLAFEEKILSKFKKTVKLLPSEAKRLFDRAVFFVHGVNGDSLVEELKKGGLESSTADSCYWEDPHLNTWLPKLGFTIEDAQTCCVLSSENLKNPKAFETLIAAIEKLQKISGVIK